MDLTIESIKSYEGGKKNDLNFNFVSLVFGLMKLNSSTKFSFWVDEWIIYNLRELCIV